jgi:hypothetical protein
MEGSCNCVPNANGAGLITLVMPALFQALEYEGSNFGSDLLRFPATYFAVHSSAAALAGESHPAKINHAGLP